MAAHGARHFDRHERPLQDDGREWSQGCGDAFTKDKPARLFVRAEPGALVELALAEVTSWAPGARELSEDHRHVSLHLSSADLRFLIETLPKALALKEKEEP